jgi:hypothetical protein
MIKKIKKYQKKKKNRIIVFLLVSILVQSCNYSNDVNIKGFKDAKTFKEFVTKEYSTVRYLVDSISSNIQEILNDTSNNNGFLLKETLTERILEDTSIYECYIKFDNGYDFQLKTKDVFVLTGVEHIFTDERQQFKLKTIQKYGIITEVEINKTTKESFFIVKNNNYLDKNSKMNYRFFLVKKLDLCSNRHS